MGRFADRLTSGPALPGGDQSPRGNRGPKTPAGKARIRLNAVRHGLSAVTPVIPGVEHAADWEAHLAGVVASLEPVGHLETVLAEGIAMALWRLRRVAAYERTLLEHGAGAAGPTAPGQFLPSAPQTDKIVRYEAHLARQCYQALHECEALQARRRGQPTPLARLDVHGLPDGGGPALDGPPIARREV